MKSAIIPPLRLIPDLRKAAESVLHKGETLSNFIEESLRSQIERRQMQRAFIERGLAARGEARASGTCLSQSEVMGSLRGILKKAQQKQRKQTRQR